MNIEINDSIYEKYREQIKKRFAAENVDNVAEHIEQLVELELRKLCAPGYELDELTNAKTRFRLEKDLDEALFGSGWKDKSIFSTKYLCVDIDNFKSYLDIHGLSAGDSILKNLAKQLQQLYPNTSIYRIGGDNFVVEIGNAYFIPIETNSEIKLKYSLVAVKAQRNYDSYFVGRAVMFHLDKAFVSFTEQISELSFNYPENI